MRISLACLTILLSTSAAQSQCARTVVTKSYTPTYQGTTYQSTYNYDNVVVPLTLPLAIPAYSFQYVPPTCLPAPKTTELQLASPEPPLTREDIRDIIRQVISESKQIEDDGPPVNTTPPRQEKTPIQYIQQSNKPDPKSSFAQSAINALSRNCASCHTGFGSKGEAVIFSSPNFLNPDAPFTSMLRDIRTGHMPPRHTGLKPTQQEINTMIAWLEGR